MSAVRPPLVVRVCLRFLRLAGRLVPPSRREAWRNEWEAEVLHRWHWLESRRELGPRSQADLARRVLGALPDAAWLRRQLTADAEHVHDLRHGVRRLRRDAAFALGVAGILGLGIGGATAIFGVVDALLLRPLPYHEPERVLTLWQTRLGGAADRDEVAPANFVDWRERARSFEALAAAVPHSYDYTAGGEPEVFYAIQVTEGFFEALGVRPRLGRTFRPEEHQAGREKVALLTHGLWQRRFGGDPGLVGRTIPLENEPYQVLGILPQEFDPGLHPTSGARGLWTPHVVEEHARRTRGSTWWNVVARLQPGTTLAQAQAEMDAIARGLAREHPRTNTDSGIEIVPLPEHLTSGVRPALGLLVGAVAVLVLVTWTNVAGLLLARGVERERELAIRSSLGAGSGRLLRQLLTETALLALIGGMLGLLLAHAGMAAIVALSPADVPRIGQLRLDSRGIAFALLLVLSTALACGGVPAWRFSRPRLEPFLRAGSATATPTRQLLRQGLAAAEVALALVLLFGAGLLLRSLERLLREDPGFRAEGVLALQVFVWDRNPTPEKQVRFFEETRERISTLPGVAAVGVVSRMPFIEANINIRSPLLIEGLPAPETGSEPSVYLSLASPGYFDVMRIPLLAGRGFDERDRFGGALVAAVNEAAARRFWPGQSPLGGRVRLRWHGRPLLAEVVGVFGAVRHERLDLPAEPEVFLSATQVPYGSMTYVVRTSMDAPSLLASVKERIWSVDPQQAFYRTATVEELVRRSVADRRFLLILMGSFAAVALVLSALGLYALLSFLAAQRTREIGVRVALGASARDVRRLVMGQGASLVLAGMGLGLVAALSLTGLLRGWLYGVSPADPVTMGAVSGLLAAASLVACLVPARRATRVDPVVALRSE